MSVRPIVTLPEYTNRLFQGTCDSEGCQRSSDEESLYHAKDCGHIFHASCVNREDDPGLGRLFDEKEMCSICPANELFPIPPNLRILLKELLQDANEIVDAKDLDEIFSDQRLEDFDRNLLDNLKNYFMTFLKPTKDSESDHEEFLESVDDLADKAKTNKSKVTFADDNSPPRYFETKKGEPYMPQGRVKEQETSFCKEVTLALTAGVLASLVAAMTISSFDL